MIKQYIALNATLVRLVVIWGVCIAVFCGCGAKIEQTSLDSIAPKNFAASKQALKKAYMRDNFHTEFYCGVVFNPDSLEVAESSLYTPRKAKTSKGDINKRAKRIEFEHIMSAHRFGSALACWKNGGRKGCAKDSAFVAMEAELRNLVPAIGEINADRSNFSFADAPDSTIFNQYGNCQVYTDFKAKKFYPRAESKGIIARIYLYMSQKYGIALSKDELTLMQKWSKQYPPNAYEKALLKTQE